MKDVPKFFGHSVYFTTISHIIWPVGIFCGHFGIFCPFWYLFYTNKKSDNPDAQRVAKYPGANPTTSEFTITAPARLDRFHKVGDKVFITQNALATGGVVNFYNAIIVIHNRRIGSYDAQGTQFTYYFSSHHKNYSFNMNNFSSHHNNFSYNMNYFSSKVFLKF
jgi:hypothetical protein